MHIAVILVLKSPVSCHVVLYSLMLDIGGHGEQLVHLIDLVKQVCGTKCCFPPAPESLIQCNFRLFIKKLYLTVMIFFLASVDCLFSLYSPFPFCSIFFTWYFCEAGQLAQIWSCDCGWTWAPFFFQLGFATNRFTPVSFLKIKQKLCCTCVCLSPFLGETKRSAMLRHGWVGADITQGTDLADLHASHCHRCLTGLSAALQLCY